MAELPLAIIPLASLFQTCLQLYDNIITTKDLKGDLNYFSICVKFERAKLDALQRTFEERLPYRAPEPLIKDALNCTKQHLIEIDILLTRHARSSTSRTQEDGGGGGGGGEEEEEVAATRFARSRLLSKTKRPFTTVAWLGHDKERLKELINALQTMNGNVRSLITPSEQNVMDFRLVSGRIATENAEELEGIRLDYESQYPEVTTAAVLKLMTLQSQGTSSVRALYHTSLFMLLISYPGHHDQLFSQTLPALRTRHRMDEALTRQGSPRFHRRSLLRPSRPSRESLW